MKLFRLILMLLLPAQVFSFGSLQISPERPKQFDSITVTYEARAPFTEIDQLKLFLYGFNADSPSPTAYEYDLTKIGESSYQTSFVNPEDVIFALLKVVSDKDSSIVADHNFGEYWDYVSHNNAGEPLRNALTRAGLSYLGNLPDAYRRNIDYDYALKLINTELKFYPKNIQANIGINTLLYEMRKITKDEFESRLIKSLDLNYDPESETAIRAVTRTLRVLDKSNIAEEIEKRFVANHPQTSLAEESLISSLSNAESQEEFVEIADEYFELFTNSPQRDRIYSAYVSSYLQMERLDALVKKLQNSKMVPRGVWANVAMQVLKDPALTRQATDAQRSTLAKDLFGYAYNDSTNVDAFLSSLEGKPAELTPSEWKLEKKRKLGSILEIGGNIYMGDNLTKAMQLFEKSKKYLNEDATANLYENMIRIANTESNYARALNLAKEAIISSHYNDFIDEQYKDLSQKLGMKDEDSITSSLDSLLDIARQKRFDKLEMQMISVADVGGYFKSPDGRVIEISDLKGNISMLYFFATWCGPCKAAHPAYEELFKQYLETTDVELLAVDVWEQTEDRKSALDKFIIDNDIKFSVFYDETDILPKRIGVTGLPTFVFLDTNGTVRFIDQGFTNSEDFINGAIDKIEFLERIPRESGY